MNTSNNIYFNYTIDYYEARTIILNKKYNILVKKKSNNKIITYIY